MPTTPPGPPYFGVLYADQYGSIQNAIAAADRNGAVVIPATYSGADIYANPRGITILDMRPGKLAHNAATGAPAQVTLGAWPVWNVPAQSAAVPRSTIPCGQPVGPLAAILSPGPMSA